MKQFKLKRQLMYGMNGEDVRLMQKLLNIANDADGFYQGRLPESGSFDMFRTRICLTKFQQWFDIDPTYCYDSPTHGMLITVVNTILRTRNTPEYLLYST
jgi:hypothetical protein